MTSLLSHPTSVRLASSEPLLSVGSLFCCPSGRMLRNILQMIPLSLRLLDSPAGPTRKGLFGATEITLRKGWRLWSGVDNYHVYYPVRWPDHTRSSDEIVPPEQPRAGGIRYFAAGVDILCYAIPADIVTNGNAGAHLGGDIQPRMGTIIGFPGGYNSPKLTNIRSLIQSE